jgi:molybdopterin converting factor small subunit
LFSATAKPEKGDGFCRKPNSSAPFASAVNDHRRTTTSMKITVTGYQKFKALMGNEGHVVLEMEKGTLRDALEALTRQYGEKLENLLFDPRTKKLKRSNLILLNGQSHLKLRDRLGSELADGDEIKFMPPVVGG